MVLSLLITLAKAQVRLSYYTPAKEVMTLKNGDYYDVEVKPKSFVLEGLTLSKGSLAIVDAFRIMVNEGEEEEHYYQTLLFESSSNPFLLKIEDMFNSNAIRFMNTSGFKIKVCIVNKPDFIKLTSRSQCKLSEEIAIKYGI